MYIKTIFAGVCIAACMLPGIVISAQKTTEIELTRSVVQAERKVIVAENMEFSKQESKAFWPVYNEYRDAMKAIEDKRVQIILEYADAWNNDNVTDEKAQYLLTEYLKFQRDKIKLKNHWVRRFNSVLSPKRTAKFYQIDNKLDVIVDYELARGVPLVH